MAKLIDLQKRKDEKPRKSDPLICPQCSSNSWEIWENEDGACLEYRCVCGTVGYFLIGDIIAAVTEAINDSE
jgi:hypothetical protein